LSHKTPIIIAGDFNSLPNSGVYQLYSTGKVSGKHKDMQQYGSKRDFVHQFNLKSAYAHLQEPISNYTPWFNGTLDYIWYNEQFDLCSLLGPPKIMEPGLPSPLWSSDHIALVCELNLLIH